MKGIAVAILLVVVAMFPQRVLLADLLTITTDTVLNGGTYDRISVYGAVAEFYGISVTGSINAYPGSTVYLHGGSVNWTLDTEGGTIHIMDGASVRQSESGWGNGQIFLHDGTVENLINSAGRPMHIYGGTISDYLMADRDVLVYCQPDYGLSSSGGEYGAGWMSGQWEDDSSFYFDLRNWPEAGINNTYGRIIPTAIPEPIILLGDLDGDGLVGQMDLDAVLMDWGNSPPVLSYTDPSGDGLVSQDDLDFVLSDWGRSVPPDQIPEPATLSLLTLGGLALMRRSGSRR